MERWLTALRIPDALVPGDDESLRQLAELVRDWRRPVDQAALVPFRLCFRLEEPAPSKDEPPPRRGGATAASAPAATCRVRSAPLVRALPAPSAEDPNLLVPTATPGSSAGARPRRWHAAARRARPLLASMVQAAGVDPRIEESLRSRKPSGFSLDARGAHDFLTRTAPALQQAGFGVILPTWWTEYGTTAQHLCVRAKVHTPERRELGAEPSLDDQVSSDWEISVGGRSLSGRDLDELARLKEPLVNVRSHWVETHIEEIHAAQMFWKNRRAGEVTARELVRMALGSADTSAGIRFAGVDASGWLGDLLRQLTDKNAIEALPTPEGFEGALRPYQERGYAWLDVLGRHGLGSCLADDMGLGKTIQTLALVERRRAAGEDRPVLLVCPTSVLTNWQREATRFTPGLGVTVHHGVGRARGYDLQQRAYAHAVVLTSYALLHRDLEDLHMVQWSGVVLDEAQNIKNPSTKQSQAVRMLKADYRIALTGTPVENHVGDLWSIMDFLNPGFLGTRQEFKRNYFVPIQAFRDREASERLHRIAAVHPAPPEERPLDHLGPAREERDEGLLHAHHRAGTPVHVGGGGSGEAHPRLRGHRAPRRDPGRAHQAEAGLQPPGALSRRRLGGGRPLGQAHAPHRDARRGDRGRRPQPDLHPVRRDGIDPPAASRRRARVRGAVPARRRVEAPARRADRALPGEESDAPPIFVLSLKAGGLGLNLTAANHVFHFDRWWNPAVEDQATDRAFRIGQTRNVQVHKYVCAGTLEERIDEMIERKRTIAEDIVGTGEAWITELSDEELHDMFALRKDAVRE